MRPLLATYKNHYQLIAFILIPYRLKYLKKILIIFILKVIGRKHNIGQILIFDNIDSVLRCLAYSSLPFDQMQTNLGLPLSGVRKV